MNRVFGMKIQTSNFLEKNKVLIVTSETAKRIKQKDKELLKMIKSLQAKKELGEIDE